MFYLLFLFLLKIFFLPLILLTQKISDIQNLHYKKIYVCIEPDFK